MSGAGPTIFALHPPPSSPRRRGSRLASARMNGRPDARAVMSAITGGPGAGGVLYGGTNLDPRLRGDDGIEGVQRLAEGGPDRGTACFGVCHSGLMVLLRTARVRRCRCRVRPTLAAVVRPCRAPPPPCSPHTHHRHPHMSGAGPAIFAPHPTTVIPAQAGIQVGFHGNERAARCAGGRVGHHRWTRGGRRSLWGDEPGSPPARG